MSFDLKSRTVTVADIAGESTAQPPVSVKIASVTASGVSQPGTARFSADSIDLTDIEIGVEMPSETVLRVTYRAPRVAVKDYFGPAGVQRLPASSSLVDLYRFGFEQLAIMRATSVVAPSLTGKMKFSAAMISLDWGQFVGPIPSKVRLTVKMSAPLDVSDPGQKMLVAAASARPGRRRHAHSLWNP